MRVCVHVCAYVYVCVRVSVCLCMCISLCVCVCTCPCACACECVCVRVWCRRANVCLLTTGVWIAHSPRTAVTLSQMSQMPRCYIFYTTCTGVFSVAQSNKPIVNRVSLASAYESYTKIFLCWLCFADAAHLQGQAPADTSIHAFVDSVICQDSVPTTSHNRWPTPFSLWFILRSQLLIHRINIFMMQNYWLLVCWNPAAFIVGVIVIYAPFLSPSGVTRAGSSKLRYFYTHSKESAFDLATHFVTENNWLLK